MKNDAMIERMARWICMLKGINPDYERPRGEGYAWEMYIDAAESIINDVLSFK